MAYIIPPGSTIAFQGTVPYSVIGNTIGSVISVQQGSIAAFIIGGSVAGVANQSISGTVTAIQGANAGLGSSWPIKISNGTQTVNVTASSMLSVSVDNSPTISGSVAAVIVGGSIAASFTPPANQSVSGTVTVGSILVFPGIVSAANSTTSPVTSTLTFTGTGEEWKDFGAITLNVFTDAISAVDGLSIQQSSDNVNWDIRDTYTIPSMVAGGGKTYQLQPAARFGRIVYTQGAQNSGAFRLQTIYHPQYTKPSSQRPSDAYTNETDLEQQQAFNMVYNGATWDRMRGTTAGTIVTGSVQQGTTPWIIGSVYGNISGSVAATIIGTPNVNVAGSVVAFQGGTQITSLVSTIPSSVQVGASLFGQLPAGTAMLGSIATYQGTVPWAMAGSVAAFVVGNASVITVPQLSSVLAIPIGSVITVFQAPSIVGTYAEDAASASGDKGFLVMGARNDTLASVTSNDGDYSSHVVGPAGELIAANAPLTKWISGTASMLGGVPLTTSVTVIAAQGASIFTYITGIQVANLGSASVLISFGAATSSLIAYTIAPAGGGSNIYFQNGIKTNANSAFSASVSGTASIYISAQGFISKT